MDVSDLSNFENAVSGILGKHLPPTAFEWLQEKAHLIRHESNSVTLNITFAAIPKKTGKAIVDPSTINNEYVENSFAGLSILKWPADRLARVWLLMQLDAADKEGYHSKIESLFKAAEVNELVALYSSLPVLKYPEEWKLRCAEGIRSNIGSVLEAIMYENPYPHQFLDEPAWNQLVLKAFFTDKDVNRIHGLDERANRELASILVDYAHERWAAHRSVNPLLWRLVSPFIEENNFPDILKLYNNGEIREKKAAVLACYQSGYAPAKQLAQNEPAMLSEIQEHKLGWELL